MLCGVVLRIFVYGGILVGVLQAVVEEEVTMLMAGVLAIGTALAMAITLFIFTVIGAMIAGEILGLIFGVLAAVTSTGALLGVGISALLGTEIKRSMLAAGLYIILTAAFEILLTIVLFAMA